MCVNIYWVLLLFIFSALTLGPSVKEYRSIAQWEKNGDFFFSSRQILRFTLFIFPSKHVENVTYRYCCSSPSQLNKWWVQPPKRHRDGCKKGGNHWGQFYSSAKENYCVSWNSAREVGFIFQTSSWIHPVMKSDLSGVKKLWQGRK